MIKGGIKKVTRLRILAAIFLVTTVLAFGFSVPAEAQIPPALYRCTVYDSDVLVGAGRTVDAYVGTDTTPRASGTTDASGVCILEVPVTQQELNQSEAISFKVDGVLADETPDVDVTMSAPDVRLDVFNLTEWTFMVYLDGDNDLEEAGIDDFMEMSSALSPVMTDLNVVVQFDRIPGYSTAHGNWVDCNRFLVTPGMIPTAGNAVQNIGEVNMGDPATLVDFVIWTMSNYPAKHYALVLWDHGSGWKSQGVPQVKGICWDDTNSYDYLTSPQLDSALADIFSTSGVVLDIVGFDACVMGMAEIFYLIAPYAHVGIASEQTEPFDGWPYDLFLDDLGSNPSMTRDSLATLIVTEYMNSYGFAGQETLSAMHSMQVRNPTLASAVSEFSTAMMASGEWANIASARAQTEEFDELIIDLYHFAQEVKAKVTDPTVQAKAQDVMDAIDLALIAEGHGALHPNAHGMSIYFPCTHGGYWPSYETELDFTADTLWDEFLNWYLAQLPSCPSLYFWNGNHYVDNGFIIPGAIPRENEYVHHSGLKGELVAKDNRYWLQIRETEPEMSFIDDAKLLVVHRSGDTINKRIVLAPVTAEHSQIGDVRPALRFSDDRYVSMLPGDVVTLSFPYYPLWNQEWELVFVAEGYYMPLEGIAKAVGCTN